MIASVYIKDGNIHFYNEENSLSGLGGIAYELGRPLLDFVCYEPERFVEGFSTIASAFEIPDANLGAYEPEILESLEDMTSNFQQKEMYVSFYLQSLVTKIYSGDSPQEVIAQLYENFQQAREFMIGEIELLLKIREDTANIPPMECLLKLDEVHKKDSGEYVYLENPFQAFYGVTKPPEIVELYEINTLEDLFRFEFVKMIEQNIFIKKCKNCEQFFIPRRRADAEYCNRTFGDTNRKCSEIGATLRYEKKVAGNPILEAHKKAYRRLHSRVRAKKMTNTAFMKWSDESVKKRDECLAGSLAFEEFVDWLELGRVRKARGSS
jgi:hypothetical protein